MIEFGSGGVDAGMIILGCGNLFGLHAAPNSGK
jgi:hypothetical protein